MDKLYGTICVVNQQNYWNKCLRLCLIWFISWFPLLLAFQTGWEKSDGYCNQLIKCFGIKNKSPSNSAILEPLRPKSKYLFIQKRINGLYRSKQDVKACRNWPLVSLALLRLPVYGSFHRVGWQSVTLACIIKSTIDFDLSYFV